MARIEEFDPDAALRKALELFWERGYEATSMADLVQHPGVARASIYATFGGKRDLYVKAVERYLQTRDPAVVEASWDTLEAALTSALTRARAQGEISGDKDPRTLARFLLVVMQGTRVLGRAHPDPGRLRDATAQALAVLD